jgi:hypothetical protein
MEKIIYRLVFNTEEGFDEKGRSVIRLEATQYDKKRYLSTNVFIQSDQWNSDTLLVKNHPDMNALNRYLQEFTASLERKELNKILQGEPFDVDDLLINNKIDDISFTDFMKKEIDVSYLKISTKKIIILPGEYYLYIGPAYW